MFCVAASAGMKTRFIVVQLHVRLYTAHAILLLFIILSASLSGFVLSQTLPSSPSFSWQINCFVMHCRHCLLIWPRATYEDLRMADRYHQPDTLEISRFLKPVLAAVNKQQLPGVQQKERREKQQDWDMRFRLFGSERLAGF
jgi:hypothetical protein